MNSERQGVYAHVCMCVCVREREREGGEEGDSRYIACDSAGTMERAGQSYHITSCGELQILPAL